MKRTLGNRREAAPEVMATKNLAMKRPAVAKLEKKLPARRRRPCK